MDIEELPETPAAYALYSNEYDYIYKGSARNLKRRILDHLHGRVRHTKNKRPLRLIHFDCAQDFSSVLKRETWLKSGAGREFLRSLLH